MVFFLLGVALALVLGADSAAAELAKGVTKGKITDKNGNPAVNVRVKVMDSDWPTEDDEMSQGFTDSSGYYELRYEGKHWDDAPHGLKIWRPDIFIRVSTQVDGWCEDGKWNASRNWVHLGDSGITNDHPLRNDLEINLKLTNYPLETSNGQRFVHRENMCCSVDFFFHYSCFGCAYSGEKIEWSVTSTNRPLSGTRCWFKSMPQCRPADWEAIRRCGTRQAEPQRPPEERFPPPGSQ